MITAVLPALITEEEYLSNPEYEHCEYVERDGEQRELTLGETLDGGDVLPGFELLVDKPF